MGWGWLTGRVGRGEEDVLADAQRFRSRVLVRLRTRPKRSPIGVLGHLPGLLARIIHKPGNS